MWKIQHFYAEDTNKNIAQNSTKHAIWGENKKNCETSSPAGRGYPSHTQPQPSNQAFSICQASPRIPARSTPLDGSHQISWWETIMEQSYKYEPQKKNPISAVGAVYLLLHAVHVSTSLGRWQHALFEPIIQ